MAMTNAVSSSKGQSASVPLRAARVRHTFDASYAAGGYAVDYAAISGLESIGSGNAPLVVVPEAISDMGYRAQYDRANGKIIIYDETNDAEAANSLGALDGVTFDVLVVWA